MHNNIYLKERWGILSKYFFLLCVYDRSGRPKPAGRFILALGFMVFCVSGARGRLFG